MKQNQIFMVIGVIALLLVIFNWNKIFKPKTMRGGGEVGTQKYIQCVCGDEIAPQTYSVCKTGFFRGCNHCCQTPSINRSSGGAVKTVSAKPSSVMSR